MFKNIIVNAMIVGIVVGAIFGILQNFTTTPIILAAEAYEVSQSTATETSAHSHGSTAAHSHDADAWAPDDGIERVGYTILSAILTAIGFAMLTIAAMAASGKASILSGILFGLAGYISFYVAPSLGLLPEIPGSVAAQLEGRQGWWLMTVVLTAGGLAAVAFIQSPYRFFGLSLLIVPHILGAPVPEHHGFANTDPVAVEALTALSGDFIVMTAITLFIFWLLLGTASSLVTAKFLKATA